MDRDVPFTDLGRLDADLRRVEERLARERLELRAGDAASRERARARDPFGAERHVAGQSAYRALASLSPPAWEVLHRDGLLRWVHELLQARIGRDLELEEQKRLVTPAEDGTRARARPTSLDASSSTPEGEGEGDTFARAFARVLLAGDVTRGEEALAGAARLAGPIAAVRRERRARRLEASRRLGLAHPSALAAPAGVDDPSGTRLARAVLDATEPLAIELHRAARKRAGGKLSPVLTMHDALARDVREGWPAKLVPRWLEDVFGALVPRARRTEALAFGEPLGAATFLRAAYAFGAALREQGTARSLPFALARDPYAGAVHRSGALFALALAEPLFQVKRLGVSRGVAADQARSLRRSGFLALRVAAARVLLAEGERTDPSLFEELGLRVFGAPLPEALCDAWPSLRASDVARLAAMASAHGELSGMIDRFDEDWFANPRAGAHLAGVACGPVVDGTWPDDVALARLARASEEMLG